MSAACSLFSQILKFMGTSADAVRSQIWTALIAMLILRFLQLKAKWGWSLSNLVALLRMNLFTHRDLWAWLDTPFDTPHAADAPLQTAPATLHRHKAESD